MGRSCPACGEVTHHQIFEKASYQYVACDACRAVYINPIPLAQALNRGYDELSADYFLDERRLAVDDYLQRHAREIALLNRVAVRGKLLDVGCATGSFLQAASHAGLRDLLGIDIAGPSIDVARRRGFRAEAGDFPSGVFEPNSFAIVTMWNTLEHVPAPDAFVREAWRVLEPGGILAMSMPNYASLSVRLVGTRYRYIGLAHLNYFTPRTVRVLLSRNRFDVVHIETRSFNPYVVWRDWSGDVPDTEKMIRETELSKTFKTTSKFAPARVVYAAVDRTLRAIGWGDSLLIAARKPIAS